MSQLIIRCRNAAQALFPFFTTYQIKKFLLVCDRVFPRLKLAQPFQSCPVPYVIFDRFTPNPVYEDVCQGVELFRQQGCDAIVAVGGGSCLDVAKCIKLFSTMEPGQSYLTQDCKENHIPLIAIPTTSGTGSESTRFAVIYDRGVKQSIASPAAIPQLAILDADVLDTLPLYQKKCTMMDALCQAIESWWSVHATEQSQNLSRRAVHAILRAMDGYLANRPAENESMLQAANLAGQAINLTQTTAAHAMSYKLTSLFGLPHGRAVAVCLPHVWQYMLHHPEHCVDARGEAYLQNTLADIARAIGCRDPMDAPTRMAGLYTALFQSERPEHFRLEELELLTASVNPVRLKNNPVALSSPAIRSLYHAILRAQMPGIGRALEGRPADAV